jgi:predicted ATPase/DNA-binding winged helix-turn-helix (wHTH) protein
MNGNSTSLRQGVAFGPFLLFVAQRLLEKEGIPVGLGSRALEILILLVERAGNVVSKEELLARVWPNLAVDENSLRVHVAGLRKALGDGQAGSRYVTNISGRGYCFVAPIEPVTEPKAASYREPLISDQEHRLPLRLARMVGRDETVRTISELLATRRFVTIHGSGGIGKTTVAVWVGRAGLGAFDGAVRFLDLGALNDPRLVPSAVASTLGLPVQSSDPTPGVISFLRTRRMLLIFDNCEHVIEAASILAERIFQEAPQVAVLATSREALRVEGEHVYTLPALESPPDGVELTTAQVLAFPAAHLFVERAAAGGHDLQLTDEDAAIVAHICRKLDGIALAIELAAGRVAVHGLRETAALLDTRLGLLWDGRRTAQPRHRTLSAMLDWSHDLLTSLERAALRRLSVFVGSFTLDAAQAIAASDGFDGPQIIDAVMQLVAKSLVSAAPLGPVTAYRMLDATRTYASARLADSGELDSVARQHAVYYRTLLERADAGQDDRSILANIRAALEWSFLDHSDATLGISLAAAAAPLFLKLSLLNECRRWTERALSTLDDATRGSQGEMELQAALGVSLMLTAGHSQQAHAALSRGLELAENLPDRVNRFRLMSRLHTYHRRAGNLERMLEFAVRAKAVAMEIAEPIGMAAANSLVGVSHHLIGNQAQARTLLEEALAGPLVSNRLNAGDFDFHHSRTRIALARTLWLSGSPDQAVQAAKAAVSDPATTNPVTLCIVLIWGFCVFRWTGDWVSGEECLERLIPHADRHGLTPYRAAGIGFRAEMLIKRGAVEAGMDMLRGSLVTLHADQYGLYATEFNRILAEGFAMTNRLDEAFALIDEAIAHVRNEGELSKPELLRVRGEFLELAANEVEAERSFLQSIELAERQSALSWRLRASNSLARLQLRQGRREEAQKTLVETYARFGEGYHTADLMTARKLLDDMARPAVSH